jgi:recombinase
VRDKDKRLVAFEPPAASAVKEVFRRRALGASWAELADYLEAQGVETPRGNAHWSKTGISGLVKNPAYLGQARSGTIVKEEAHEALVTRAEFDAAQSVTKSLLKPRDGSLAEKAILGGLARCAGCGHTLKITGNTDKRATPSTTAPAVTRQGRARLVRQCVRHSSTSTSKGRFSTHSARKTAVSRRRSMPQRHWMKQRVRSPRLSMSSTSSSLTRGS